LKVADIHSCPDLLSKSWTPRYSGPRPCATQSARSRTIPGSCRNTGWARSRYTVYCILYTIYCILYTYFWPTLYVRAFVFFSISSNY